MSKIKYKCIIFDCDGVLVDSEAISIGLLVEMAKDVGLVLNLEQAIEEFSGTSLNNCIQYIERNSGEKISQGFVDFYREESFRRFEKELKPIEGIEEILKGLTIPFCVASSGPINKIEFNLTNTGLIHHFDTNIFSAYTLQKWKPNPAIFLHAAKEMGFEPQHCAVIEDSLAGVKAGVSGGFDTYAISHKKNERLLRDAGSTTFRHMSELPGLLS